MKTAATQAKENEQTHEKSRRKSSVVPSLNLKPAPVETTRAQAHSPATADIRYTGVGGNSDESRAAEKSAEHRARAEQARRREFEKLTDKSRKAHSSQR